MSFPLLIILFLLLSESNKACPEGCKTCAGGNDEYRCNSNSCENGYYEIKSPEEGNVHVKCEKCKATDCVTCSASPTKCSSCKIGYFIKGANCEKCDSSCRECDKVPTICTSCSYGNYLSNSQCFPCNSNCDECEVTASHCTSCVDGKYLSGTRCYQCNSNCRTCVDSATHCTSCQDGEYVSADAQCLPCDSNCKTCKTTATTCLSCYKGYYLSSSTCEKCPYICTECENPNKCTSCISNYFENNFQCLECNINCSTTIDGCKCGTCEDGYYIKNYQCFQCNSPCETCVNSPNYCVQCIPDYYKKESDSSSGCYKDPDGYYLDYDIYKKCYQSCKGCDMGGNKAYHNCSECIVGLPFEVRRNDYINCYKNCSNYYYFDSGDDFHCTSDKSCPDAYPYLLENKFECIEVDLDDILDYLLGDGLNGTESREEQIKFYDNILSNFEDLFTSELYDTSDIENGKEQILKTEKLTITFTTTQNQKNNINNNVNNNMTAIDLGECQALLREFYHIPDNELLYMKKVDVIQDGMKTMKVEYDVYAKLFGTKLINLNLTVCEKSQVSISIPIEISEELEKLNGSSSYYNDVCYTTTSEDGTDISMKDRQNDFINKDRIVCQDDCFFTEYDYDNSKAKCSCNVKKCSESYANMEINKAKILDNFKNINNLINYKFLVCYKKII